MSHLDEDSLIKIVLIGNSGAGKTCILRRYMTGQYSDSYISTVGVDFMVKILNIDGNRVKIQVWDTAGQERFRTVTKSYYRGSHIAIVVFDVSEIQQKGSQCVVDELSHWVNDIHSIDPEIQITFLANKCDVILLKDIDPKGDGNEILKDMGICGKSEKYQPDIPEIGMKQSKMISPIINTSEFMSSSKKCEEINSKCIPKEILLYAESQGIKCFGTSAKYNLQVEESFTSSIVSLQTLKDLKDQTKLSENLITLSIQRGNQSNHPSLSHQKCCLGGKK